MGVFGGIFVIFSGSSSFFCWFFSFGVCGSDSIIGLFFWIDRRDVVGGYFCFIGGKVIVVLVGN